MTRRCVAAAGIALLPVTSLASIYNVTAIAPAGANLTGVQTITSITPNSVAYSNLTGPTSSSDSASLGAAVSCVHSAVSPSENSLLGMDMGSADLGLGNDNINTGYAAVWFPQAIQVAALNDPDVEFFVLDWAASTDTFVVQL